VFVAVSHGGDEPWYGELILCFGASYRPTSLRARDLQLCLVRWLRTSSDAARGAGRPMTASEKAGPFETFRWSTCWGSYRTGHPLAREPHYGVVRAETILYRAPIYLGPAEDPADDDPVWRLVTDMFDRF
jgi:hypothetical protein